MILWVFILALLLIVTAIPLIAVGAYKKFKQELKDDIYLIMFVIGCVFIGFGLFLLILSLVAGDSKTKYYEYLPQIHYPPMNIPYNFQKTTQQLFKPTFENYGWSSNIE
jgi:hypothetical protein